MNQIVPPRFLFRWSFDARYLDEVPRSKGRLLDLSEEYALPTIAELDHRQEVAHIKLAWNERGLALGLTVSGRSRPVECVDSEVELSDGIHLWIDTRNTQNVHRATRFCHHFCLLPLGGGPKRVRPTVRSFPVARAREETALPDCELVQVQSETSKSGYWLDAWFPTEVFAGFDPLSNPKIGFQYLVHDTELGDQTLAVDREFPFESDPSLWQTIELRS